MDNANIKTVTTGKRLINNNPKPPRATKALSLSSKLPPNVALAQSLYPKSSKTRGDQTNFKIQYVDAFEGDPYSYYSIDNTYPFITSEFSRQDYQRANLHNQMYIYTEKVLTAKPSRFKSAKGGYATPVGVGTQETTLTPTITDIDANGNWMVIAPNQ